MKKFNLFALIVASFGALFLGIGLVHAQTDSSTINTAIETGAAVATPFIVTFAASHAWLVTFLVAVASFRLLFKPIVSAVEMYVKSTASENDDAAVAKVEASLVFKVFAWLLDYLGSIKVGPQRNT